MEEVEGLIGKAEEYFGKRVTVIALAIIGMGALAAAIKSIFSNVLLPIVTAAGGFRFSLSLLGNIVLIAMELIYAYFVMSSYRKEKLIKAASLEARETLDQTKVLHADARKEMANLIVEYRDLVVKSKLITDHLSFAQLITRELVQLAKDDKPMPLEQVEVILSLLDIALETQP
ncbi:hypothetical protein [uncultured Caballeronia sp.]|uniref:hypothetical protein n=1 Tax=uncultured Caballeronia sp. TaxID=1827198 RepID=UPI0035CB8BDD